MFDLGNVRFRYEPFPLGVARPILAGPLYNELAADFPPKALFRHMPKFGNKYSLSEKYNPENYKSFIAGHERWRALHSWVKSPDFIHSVLDALKRHGIDLGFKRVTTTGKGMRAARVIADIAAVLSTRRSARLTSRFEFSMLPAAGGEVMPHTDTPSKLVTLVVSMSREGEWDPAYGGGLEINRTSDPAYAFNWTNRQVPWSAIETIDTVPFVPNQGIVFVKTFNSLHSVRPMRAFDSPALRKTLTIVIEKDE